LSFVVVFSGILLWHAEHLITIPLVVLMRKLSN